MPFAPEGLHSSGDGITPSRTVGAGGTWTSGWRPGESRKQQELGWHLPGAHSQPEQGRWPSTVSPSSALGRKPPPQLTQTPASSVRSPSRHCSPKARPRVGSVSHFADGKWAQGSDQGAGQSLAGLRGQLWLFPPAGTVCGQAPTYQGWTYHFLIS